MPQIGLKRYRLLFYGNILDEADPEQARQALASRYRLTPEKLDACFSGRKVALRQEMDEATAYQLQSELEDAGLITHLELTHEAATDIPASPIAPDLFQFNSPPVNAMHEGNELKIASALADTPAAPLNKLPWLVLGIFMAAAIPLTWFGLPWYQAYQLQQKAYVALTRAEPIKQQVTAFIGRTGFWPNTSLDANLPEPSSYRDDIVHSISIASQAVIVITLNPALPHIGGKHMLLIPAQHPRGLDWHCESNLPARYLPAPCSPAR